jgi:8-oxo-dGTP pyrophosphatase MutT (NUDIX family)
MISGGLEQGGQRETGVHLGDGGPDGGSGLPVSLAEVLVRLLCELLGAAEMFRSCHESSSCLGVRFWSDTQPVPHACSRSAENGDVTEPASTPGQQAVAAAIVISRLGVLAGRRRDGNPPWTFPAGKIEPGESPADAAVRETREETGLRIRAADVIGGRIHPLTGVRIIYVAATPANETEVQIREVSYELTEVRWVSLAEADELMSGAIYEPCASTCGRA